MEIRKIAGWAVTVFLAYYLLTRPVGASHAMESLFGLLRTFGDSVAAFCRSIS
jgi:hypothetical protein